MKRKTQDLFALGAQGNADGDFGNSVSTLWKRRGAESLAHLCPEDGKTKNLLAKVRSRLLLKQDGFRSPMKLGSNLQPVIRAADRTQRLIRGAWPIISTLN
ncbi:hypothetical protein ACPOL_1420 [Acidisarcina polymorpha]|uniref:Uncharacterized protein n=1 Tax=Acidisarcina polymorpha TaxID=2211140 RepID=A0A2Z5FWH2_9BACT|nr:hypothetical protein ACPOL_1420 [Acidisarcina polymorpha]